MSTLRKVEEPPLGSLAAPADLEENASHHFLSSSLTLTPPNVSRMDFLDGPAAIHGSRLIISCATQDATSNEYIYPEILMIKDLFPIYSFGLILPAITLADIFLLVPVLYCSLKQVLRAI